MLIVFSNSRAGCRQRCARSQRRINILAGAKAYGTYSYLLCAGLLERTAGGGRLSQRCAARVECGIQQRKTGRHSRWRAALPAAALDFRVKCIQDEIIFLASISWGRHSAAPYWTELVEGFLQGVYFRRARPVAGGSPGTLCVPFARGRFSAANAYS